VYLVWLVEWLWRLSWQLEAASRGHRRMLLGSTATPPSMLGTTPRLRATTSSTSIADRSTPRADTSSPRRILGTIAPRWPASSSSGALSFETTTTGSSVADWRKAARSAGLEAPTVSVCCYPTEAGLVGAMADLTEPLLAEARRVGTARVLFSAHGLPEKIIERGDPYQWQVETTAAALAERLGLGRDEWRVCYQSRVGPLQWIGPSTEEEIAGAGADKTALVVVPVAFVSEHSETLVELDIEYRALAREAGVTAYLRVPTVDASRKFIAGLAHLVRNAAGADMDPTTGDWTNEGGGRICPASHGRCPFARKTNGRLTSQPASADKV